MWYARFTCRHVHHHLFNLLDCDLFNEEHIFIHGYKFRNVLDTIFDGLYLVPSGFK